MRAPPSTAITPPLRHLAAEAIVIPFVTITTYALSRRLVFGVPKVAAHR